MPDIAYFEKLARLKLAIDKKSTASYAGPRKSARKGKSAEFSDFREYMPGDDIRSIDWNAYGRLDRLYVKEYMEEKEGTVNIFYDTSLSMDFGKKKKIDTELELVGALAYICISNMDRAVLRDMSGSGAAYNVRGSKSGFMESMKYLDNIKCGGTVSPADTFKKLDKLSPGVTFVMSDYLSEEFIPGQRKAGKEEKTSKALAGIIKKLRFLGQRPVIVHILSEEEDAPDMTGTLNLIDSETDARRKVTMERKTLDEYREAKEGFKRLLARTCRKCGADYIFVSTADGFDKIIFEKFRMLYI